MPEPTEAELIAALNAELEAQGYNYRVEHGAHRGAETEALVIRSIEFLLAQTGRPPKESEVAESSGVTRTTTQDALRRLLASGRVIGSSGTGYVVRKGT